MGCVQMGSKSTQFVDRKEESWIKIETTYRVFVLLLYVCVFEIKVVAEILAV